MTKDDDISESMAQFIAEHQKELKRLEREAEKIVKCHYPELKQKDIDVANGPLGKIKLCFAKEFAQWKLVIPEENLASRKKGSVNDEGWSIKFCFGKENDMEYMDYYSYHRMTNASLQRIYENGEKELLASIDETSWHEAWKKIEERRTMKDLTECLKGVDLRIVKIVSHNTTQINRS